MNLLRGGGLPVARLFGMEVRLHLSWVLILAIVTAGVGSQLSVSQPEWSPLLQWGAAGSIAVLFLLSVLVHELVHALAARRQGMSGGSVTLLVFGGAPSLADRPARPRDEAIVAVSGPVVTVLLAGAFFVLFRVAADATDATGEAFAQVALVVAALNAGLVVLHLLPVYPLDGGRLLRAALWAATGSEDRAMRGVAITGQAVGWVVLAAGFVVLVSGDLVDGAMLAVCGWFLGGTARSVERRSLLQGLLAGLRVESVMERDLPEVSPQLTLDTFAAQYLAGKPGASLPVVRDSVLLGLIGSSQLRRIRRTTWPTLRAADVMISPPALPVLAPDDDLWAAAERLRRTGLDGLPVLRGQELLGVFTRRGLVTAIQARTRPAPKGAT